MDETTPVSSASVEELLRRGTEGNVPALQELAARAREVEESKKQAEESRRQAENAEARAASAEAKNRVLKYVWLMKHRCSIQHRRYCNASF